MKIRFAVAPPLPALSEENFPDYLKECEQLGFDTIWLSDIPLGGLGDPLVSLTYAAGCTTKLKLGANVVPLGRHPLWLAKQLAQLDRLSRGRLLVSFVPGLGSPAERNALGYPSGNRGRVIDEMIDMMRQWWDGKTITGEWEGLRFDDVAVTPTPAQEPLEVWLGGISPAALERVAKVADGWLTSAATPREAGDGRRTIQRRAAEFERVVDTEHFGISIPYSLEPPSEEILAPLRKRRKDGDLSEVVPIGRVALQELIDEHVDQGLSKFVVRSLAGLSADISWRDDLRWLADAVLPRQT